jgi:hypothetical protein
MDSNSTQNNEMVAHLPLEETTKPKLRVFNLWSLLWWIILGLLGGALGFLLWVFVITATFSEVIRELPLNRLRPLTVGEDILLWLELGLLMGLPVGLAQKIVLDRHVPKGHGLLWFLLTWAGAGLGVISYFAAQLLILQRIFTFVVPNEAYWETSIILLMTVGLIVNTAQWLALRGVTTKVVYWIPIGSVSLGIAWLLTSITAYLWQTYPFRDTMLHVFELLILFIAIYSALTGFGLAWVLRDKTDTLPVAKAQENKDDSA